LFLVLFSSALFLSCDKNDTHDDEANIYIALPTAPVKVKNTEGTWMVYEMHIKTPILENVAIFYDDELLFNYSDFVTRDDLHIASIWLEFPAEGWEKEEIAHEFYYKESSSSPLKKHVFTL